MFRAEMAADNGSSLLFWNLELAIIGYGKIAKEAVHFVLSGKKTLTVNPAQLKDYQDCVRILCEEFEKLGLERIQRTIVAEEPEPRVGEVERPVTACAAPPVAACAAPPRATMQQMSCGTYAALPETPVAAPPAAPKTSTVVDRKHDTPDTAESLRDLDVLFADASANTRGGSAEKPPQLAVSSAHPPVSDGAKPRPAYPTSSAMLPYPVSTNQSDRVSHQPDARRYAAEQSRAEAKGADVKHGDDDVLIEALANDILAFGADLEKAAKEIDHAVFDENLMDVLRSHQQPRKSLKRVIRFKYSVPAQLENQLNQLRDMIAAKEQGSRPYYRLAADARPRVSAAASVYDSMYDSAPRSQASAYMSTVRSKPQTPRFQAPRSASKPQASAVSSQSQAYRQPNQQELLAPYSTARQLKKSPYPKFSDEMYTKLLESGKEDWQIQILANQR